MTIFHLLPEWLDTATDVARQAAEVLKGFWGNLKDIREKDFPGNLVTEADRESEKIIIKNLSAYFPTHQILAEESGLFKKESPFMWAIDPLDGTTNFAHHHPMAAVSIGLIHEDEAVLGVVYNPFTDELFQAYRGGGATLNGRPIAVSHTADLAHSLLTTGFPYDRRENADNNYAQFCRLTDLTQGVRRIGAASLDLSYVACGRFDGYWERSIYPWDIVAGTVIVREAGGEVSDYAGPLRWDTGRILATNGYLHAAIGTILAEYGLDKIKNQDRKKSS